MTTKTEERGRPKFRQGVVLSNKMDKTVIIGVTEMKKHLVYGKYITSTKKFVAHDGEDKCNVGDEVKIVETRPISRTKRWKVVEILKVTKDDIGQVI
ncbi:MAG: 30S ribosomal protein S17 [bacterium]|nr:30S ribosomal protein S17 [bacterium]